MYVKTALPVALAFTLWTAAANAQSATQGIISQYQDLGFQYIDIEEGRTQTKVEAIMPDGRKVEVVYDNSTGRILKQENDRADREERRERGVDVDREDYDFVDASGNYLDGYDDDDDDYDDRNDDDDYDDRYDTADYDDRDDDDDDDDDDGWSGSDSRGGSDDDDDDDDDDDGSDD
ncbi:MAG: hypothetical protein AAGA06_12045 [Pseudomonadota bacterium]